MTNEELNTALYKKLFADLDTYRNWLMQQPPDEILRHAYEFTTKQDIVLALEYNDLSNEQAQALLSAPAPLDEIFHDFEQIEGDHMDIIWGCIETRAKDIIESQKPDLLSIPVYPYSCDYAKAHGQFDQYQKSHKANVDCKDAIEAAIRRHYRDNRLDGQAVTEVVQQFGVNRIGFVLANTLHDKSWDGRISTANKVWAKGICLARDSGWNNNRAREYAIGQAHPGLLDVFATTFRREQLKARDSPEQRPSVLEQMQHLSAAERPPTPRKPQVPERN